MTLPQYAILAVAGPADAEPTPADLGALGKALKRRHVRVVRVADDRPAGAAVQAMLEAMPLGPLYAPGDGEEPPTSRLCLWEQWQADPHRFGPRAAEMRARAMFAGDADLAGCVFVPGSGRSRGPAAAVIVWPGTDATTIGIARDLGVRVVPIGALA